MAWVKISEAPATASPKTISLREYERKLTPVPEVKTEAPSYSSMLLPTPEEYAKSVGSEQRKAARREERRLAELAKLPEPVKYREHKSAEATSLGTGSGDAEIDAYLAGISQKADQAFDYGAKGQLGQTIAGGAQQAAGGLSNALAAATARGANVKRNEGAPTLGGSSGDAELDAYLAKTTENAQKATTVTEEREEKLAEISKAAEQQADMLAEKAQNNLETAKGNSTALGKVGVDIGSQAVQMAIDLAAGTVTGTGAMVPMAIRSFGMGAQEARQKGYDELDQFRLGVTSAMTEYFTEKLFGGNPVYDADIGLVNRFVNTVTKNKAFNKTLMKVLASTPFDVLNEGLEEIVSDIVNPLAELAITGNYDAPTWDEVIYDGAIGAAMSILGLSGQAMINNGRAARQAGTTGGETGNISLPTPEAYAQQQAAARGGTMDTAAETPVQTQKTASTGETVRSFDEAIAGMDEQRSGEFRKAQEIARKFGAEVDVSNIENGAAGVYQAGKITLNPNTKNPVRQVLVHELTHHMETSGMYGQFADRILNYAAEEMGLDVNALKESIRKEYAAGGIELDDAGAQRELVAKFCEDELFTSEKAINRLAQTDRNLFQKIYDWVRDAVRKLGGENSFLVDAERMYKKALESVGQMQGSEAAQYSIVEPFTDDNGNTYSNAVLLDTDFFDGISPRNWGNKLKGFVENRAENNPVIMPIYDENGKKQLLTFASKNDRIRKGGSKNRVINELFETNDNISKLAVIHIDEIVEVSEENNPYYSEGNTHEWLDKNGWLHRNAYVINAKNGAIYNLTFDIAKAEDGRTILYATKGKIKKAGSAAVNSLITRGSQHNSDFSNTIPQTAEDGNRQFSYGGSFSDLSRKYPNLNLNEDISDMDGVPAVELQDGSILPIPEHPSRGNRYTHVEFIEKNRIDVDDLRSGGWIGNGVYEPSYQSDTARYIERQKAKKKVAELTGKPYEQFKENSYGRGFRELAAEQKSGKSRYEEMQLPKPGENVLNNRTQPAETETPKTVAELTFPTPEAYAKQKNGTLSGENVQKAAENEQKAPETKTKPGAGESETETVDEDYLDSLLNEGSETSDEPGRPRYGLYTPEEYREELQRRETLASDENAPPERKRGDLDELVRMLNEMANPLRDTVQKEPGDSVTTEAKKNKAGVRERAGEAWSAFKRLMVDAGDTVTQIGKETGDKVLYPYYNFARASAQAGTSMITEKQTNISADVVGKGLNEIFDPIRAKGKEYYQQFQLYMYHKHNVARMSRTNPQNIRAARNSLDSFYAENPQMMGMTENQLEALSHQEETEEGLLAQENLRLIRAFNRAQNMQNKPIFGGEVGAQQSKEEAARLLREHPEFAELEKDVKTYIQNLQQYRVDSGLLSEDQKKQLDETYPDYVPTYRASERDAKKYRTDSVTVGRTIGRAEGGDEKLLPLHVALARQTMSVVREGSKNRFGQRLLDLSGSKDLKNHIYDAQEFDNDIDADTFDAESDPTPKKTNTFNVYKDGKLYEMTVDNGLFDAVKALSPMDMSAAGANLLKPVRFANDLFKKLVTGWNPTFMARNFVRDIQDAGLYTRDAAAFAKNYPRAIKEIASNGEYWQKYKALGGTFSSVFDYDTGEVKKQSKLSEKTIGRVEALNMAIEQAPRLAEFIGVVEAGDGSYDSLMDAMYAAADVTTNFGRGGSLAKFLNANVVPFLNPGIQGFDKAVRRFTETKGVKEWTKLAVRVAALGVAPIVLNGMLYGDDDEYEDLRDSDKDTNYLFKIGDNLWLKIPKGRALSVLGMTADRAADIARGEKVNWKDYFTTAANQVAPQNPLENNIMQAWLDADLFDEDSAGRTWYGTPIENQRLQNYAPGERYDAKTDEISKWLGKTFDLSPKKINYLLNQYSGVAGDVLLPLLTPTAERDMFSAAFTVDSAYSNKLSEEFYDISDKLTYAKNDVNATEKDKAAYKWWNKQSQALSEVNAAIREIEADTELTDKEKKELLRAQYISRNAIEKAAIEDYEKYTYELSLLKGDTAEELYDKANYRLYGQDYAFSMMSETDRKKAEKLTEAGMSYLGILEQRKILDALEPEDGKGDVSKWQKAKAIDASDLDDNDLTIAMADVLESEEQEKGWKIADKNGITSEYIDALEYQQTKATGIKDVRGRTVEGSIGLEVMREIDSYDLTNTEKGVLYQALGYNGENMWRSKYKGPDFEAYYYLNESEREKYWDYCSGMTATKFTEYITELSTFHNTEVNGKVKEKREDKVRAYINGLKLPTEQKNGLYLAAGYKESTLNKCPWYSTYQSLLLPKP